MLKSETQIVGDERQGFCHVSQLLRMLFNKYGIDPSGLGDGPGGAVDVFSEATIATAAQLDSDLPLVGATPAAQSSCTQTTFSWFQPA